MHPFRYHSATSTDDAARHLRGDSALALGGGTDLLVFLKEGLARPEELVDLRRIPGFRTIEEREDGSLRIGAGVHVAELATDDRIKVRYPALAQSAESVGTPALRTMGTIGGNLCQRPRCWYFRRAIPCLKNGGDGCPAAVGENQYHAIFDGGPCYIVHPSDPAVALTALDASVEISGPGGARTVRIGEFYVLPRERLDRETILADGEFVSAVELPAAAAGGSQIYLKAMQRATWDFALVSAAAARRTDGSVRIALGGVAPRPYRIADSIEEDIAAGALAEDDIATLAERALYDAEPLSKNGYKVELAAALLRRVISHIARSG